MRAPLLMLDLDETLVPRGPVIAAWAAAYVAERGLDPALVDALVAADGDGFAPREELVAAAERVTGRPFDLDEMRLRVSEGYALTDALRDQLVRARDAGWRLAVVTNGPTDLQARKIVHAGLPDLVDAVCVSEEVGAWKPDPAIFEAAASRAGATLGGAWMVGDNLDADIGGAAALGVRTAWVQAPGPRPAASWTGTPDLVGATCEELVARILGGA